MKKLFYALSVAAGLLCLRSEGQTYDTNGDFVQTFVGSGIPGYLDGQGQLTEFSGPSQIVADTSSNLYVWDSGNHLIRKITPNGTVSTYIGGGTQLEGAGTNVSLSGYGGVGTMVMDHSNAIWFAASYIGYVYLLRIDASGYVTIQNGGLPSMSSSSGICFDSANNLYYSGGNRIYRYDPNSGVSQVFAGSGVSGHLDGNGIFTEFSSPTAMVCDQADNLYVFDGGLRKIDQSQNVTTVTNSFAGTPTSVDNNGNIIGVGGGSGSSYVFKLTVTTNFVLFAGTINYSYITFTNGPGSVARFNSPSGVCLSQGMLFVADNGNNRIRQISFNPQPQIVQPSNLSIGVYAGVTINGIVGRTYQIQTSSDFTSWSPKATILLTSNPYLWIDQSPIRGNHYYRALLLP
jgi:hypothetical protein